MIEFLYNYNKNSYFDNETRKYTLEIRYFFVFSVANKYR